MKVKLIAAAGLLGLAAAVSSGSANAQVARFDPALKQGTSTLMAEQVQWRGNRGWRGGRHAYRGGYYRRGPSAGAVIGGLAAGALIGGAIASQSQPYYGAPVYAAPAPVYGGNDAVAYCMQRFKSYDPASGTYLGYDGLRHPCP